ncbi:baseplate hub protein [Acidiphilium sp.]|uniref:baseplate hub protein n=1 Tax=Acidiphilium sp. TaxID=527 RepID=UPI002587245C|nr:hypothetical protein [Acidiphilium sp.]
MSGSFVQRELAFEFKLGKGQFGESGYDAVTLNGYRASVQISKSGRYGLAQAQARIYGVSDSIMNRLNTLGNQFYTQSHRFNEIAIAAGDSVRGLATVFVGQIWNAWIDFDSAPDVALVVTASVDLLAGLKPIPPTSYGAPADVATIMESLATQMGMPFENNGVSVILSYPYLAGTARQQVEKAAEAANINWSIDSSRGPLAIWPKTGYRGPSAPKYATFSPTSGMIGYPTYTSYGISFRAVFTPGQDPAIGELIQVESSQVPACGTWVPAKIDYTLESQTPGGLWEMLMLCARTVQNAEQAMF